MENQVKRQKSTSQIPLRLGVPQAWGEGRRRILHTFSDITKKEESKYVDLPKICIFATATQKEIELNRNFKRINDEITQLIKELIGKSSTWTKR